MAEKLVHPDGWTFNKEQACLSKAYQFNGVRYDIGEYKGYLVVGAAVFEGVKCPKKNRGTGGGGQTTSSSSTATPQERVAEVYGPDVAYTDGTHTATAGSGGQQVAGDDEPTRSVTQDEFGGNDAPPTGGGGGNTSTTGETANGKEAPSFD